MFSLFQLFFEMKFFQFLSFFHRETVERIHQEFQLNVFDNLSENFNGNWFTWK
jgi:hypothetical protein